MESVVCVVDTVDLIMQIGASDCEELGDGLLAQPINAITSLAYSVVGVGVLALAWRRGRVTLDAWVYGGLLVAIGLGSVLFHGPQPDGSRILHDLPITLTILYVAAADVDLLRGGRPSRWVLYLPAAALASLVTLIQVDAGSAFAGAGVLGILICEFMIFRRDLRGLAGRRALAAIGLIIVVAVAATTWVLGRTDSPVCDPDGAVQLHAVWHLISASVFGLWWLLATNELSEISETSTEPSATPSAR